MAATPQRIGRYVVQEVVGAGGFATVYRASDERLEVDVAVKVLADNHSIDPEVRARFIEEGRRLRRVRNTHLLEVYDLGDTERAQPYLVLEWADRGDLAQRMAQARRRGYQPLPNDALVVARALAEALGTLHRSHLVHRDIAPRNLLLRSRSSSPPPAATSGLIGADEQLLLADLGMSKDLARASGITVAAGTSGFAPPEQREPGGTVDLRADVWAASALVVWMALDRPPDDSGEWTEALRRSPWPDAMIPVLRRGLAPDPARRQSSIEEWLSELEEAFRPPPPPPPTTREPSSRTRRLRLALAALAIGLLAGVGIGYLAADSGSNADAHGMQVTIQAPQEVQQGDPVTVSASVEGEETWMWVAPNGEMVPGPDLRFDAVKPGKVTVRVVAANSRGETFTASHRIQVDASD